MKAIKIFDRVATDIRVATRSKILIAFIKLYILVNFLKGRDPKNFLDHDRSRVATGLFFWIATGF
jgi:hypothetical protein